MGEEDEEEEEPTTMTEASPPREGGGGGEKSGGGSSSEAFALKMLVDSRNAGAVLGALCLTFVCVFLTHDSRFWCCFFNRSVLRSK